MDSVFNSIIEQQNISLGPVQTDTLRILYHSVDKLYFQINNTAYAEVNVSLSNSIGNILFSRNILAESGVSTHEINIEELPSGIYLVQLIRGKEIFSQRAQIVR